MLHLVGFVDPVDSGRVYQLIGGCRRRLETSRDVPITMACFGLLREVVEGAWPVRAL